jgi:dihydroflavonol-4-reductase
MVIQYMQGKLPAYVKGGYDFVDVRDVAEGCLLAAEKGRTWESYLLNGAYLSLRELLGEVGQLAGLKPIPELPLFLGKAVVPFVEMAAKVTHRRPLYTEYALRVVGSNALYSHEKATAELGYMPRPMSETIRDMVAWLQENL